MNAKAILGKIVEMAGGPPSVGYVLALDHETLGELGGTLRVGTVDLTVDRPRTELGLRRLLRRSGGAQGAPVVALLEDALARRLPPDLIRGAKGARVHAVELHDILALALGVQVVVPDDEELQRLVMEHLDGLRNAISRRTLPTIVDSLLLDELLLEVAVSRRVRTATAPGLLAEWVKTPPQWSAPVRKLVCRNLPVLQGAEGRVLAWALEEPSRLRDLVVRGALLAVEKEEITKSLWGRELAPLLKHESTSLDEPALRRVVVRLATGALDELGEGAAQLLIEAERIARVVMHQSDIAKSTVLPLGLETRCYDLATRAARGEAVPETDVHWLRRHRAAKVRAVEIEVVAELARLSRWLHSGSLPAPKAGALVRITAYQRNSAFADWAATRLRRALASTASLHAEADAVLLAWRGRRDEENLAFAELLAAGYEKALFAPGVVPLHQIWQEVALRELDAASGLYLVVLDGCSYPVFLELLDELSRSEAEPLGLVHLQRGAAQGIPALALLPTITSHSRGAIFLGTIPNDPLKAETLWREQSEGTTDKARFEKNPTLGKRSRKLFLKGDLADGGAALRATLADGGVSIVAAVFNAIDDQIGSSNTGAQVRVRAQEVAGLLPSVRAALDAGRKVLVTADHGHTPFVGKDQRRGAAKTTRYLELEAGAEVHEGYMELDVAGLGGKPVRRAFAWAVGAYCGFPQVGFHGGCGLEEMVVPLAWIGRNGVPADVPAWWYAEEPTEVAMAPLTKAAPPKQKTPQSQLDLFGLTPRAASALKVETLGLPATVIASLDDRQRAALVVLRDVGSARATELAAAIGVAAGRVPGLMTQLGRKLHMAKSACFTSERLPDGELQFLWLGVDVRGDGA